MKQIHTCLKVLALSAITVLEAKADDHYSEPPVYDLRPKSTGDFHLGHVGVTGLVLSGHPGVVLKVEETTPGSPAEGKFKKGEVVTGVNGVSLKGRNPFVVLGEALTQAEAKDGKLVFDVSSEDGKQAKKVGLTIPVLGAYSPTWPLKCAKSEAIIRRLADYYSKNMDEKPIEGALACLFLLSTGDDQYLPVVKARLNKISARASRSDHTWYNGYDGVLFCEYYLRTGDASVLPVIQALCDDAKERQIYGIGWRHWGRGANPQYMDGSLLNAAFGPLVMSLLLAKECPVNVDEATLQGSLKFFYRFAGHGSIAYGDYRPEGGLSSNGKDGMAAVVMHLASGAQGAPGIFRQARDSFAASMIDSYSGMLTGHGDWGRSDAAWRGLVAAYRLEPAPAEYHSAMNRLAWWYDLSRRPSGGMGLSGITKGYDNEGSGAGAALAYTAPLKTLRITGAPRSKHGKEFTLPPLQWGRKADLDFLSTQPGKNSKDEPAHVLYYRYGNAYYPPKGDPTKLPREEIVKDVHHRNFVIRTQAAKALNKLGAYDTLERLMQDEDRRVRRAALDAIIDYRFNSDDGKQPMPGNRMTPGMLAAIRRMLADPEEAIFVVDAALRALSLAPAKEIMDSLPWITPWTTHDEWWLRHSAFIALTAAARDPAYTAQLLPTIGEMFTRENRPSARNNMLTRLRKLTDQFKADSEFGKMTAAIYQRAAKETIVIPGDRAAEGGHTLMKAVEAGVSHSASNAVPIARLVKNRLAELETRHVKGVAEALLTAVDKLPDAERQELADILSGDFRRELIRRMKQQGHLASQSNEALGANEKAAAPAEALDIDTLAALASLKGDSSVWRDIGKPAGIDRVWKYKAFFLEDLAGGGKPEGDWRKHLFYPPVGLEKWHMPDFDDSQWRSGLAPIGKGKFSPNPRDASKLAHVNRSAWGEGEILLMRTTIDVDALDYDFIRLTVLANRGFQIHLNGKTILSQHDSYLGRDLSNRYVTFPLKIDELKKAKKGKNVIAVYARSLYDGKFFRGDQIGHFDMRFQGLRQADLLR